MNHGDVSIWRHNGETRIGVNVAVTNLTVREAKALGEKLIALATRAVDAK